jgi:hypothetical protein
MIRPEDQCEKCARGETPVKKGGMVDAVTGHPSKKPHFVHPIGFVKGIGECYSTCKANAFYEQASLEKIQ